MTARHNLPAVVNSFVGRDYELRETRRLFGATRLLTLSGTGGVGKTRLAVQLAATLLDTYPDGVWLVELAPVADPNRVARAVAGVLGVAERHGLPTLHLVAEALRGQRVVLILDNCEHVLDAAARLAGALLRTCPDLHVLATSREPLSIDGEQVWRVPSLAPPEPPDTPERVAASAAAQLFVERARAVEPGFALTSRSAPAVAQVCRRLDGIPLALELATARVALLSVEQIAARLDDRFRLLVGGHRATPARHQTLLATMAWSHGLLDAAEQVLFRRLAVFSGGWTLEATEAACAGEPLAGGDIVELLAQLVDQSLVVAEPDAGGSRRYRLLETVRAYATERLAAAGEQDELRDRHAACFWTLAEQAWPDLMVLRFEGWLDRLDREQDNFRAALDWLASRNRIEEGLRLATALAEFWYIRGYAAEGRERLEHLLDEGMMLCRREGIAIPPRGIMVRANVERDAGNFAAAHDWFELSLAKEAEAVSIRADILHQAGQLAFYEGNLDQSRALQEESLSIRRRLGQPREIGLSLAWLGRALGALGERAQAGALYAESVPLHRLTGSRWGQTVTLEGLTSLVAADHPAEALRLAGAADRLRADMGRPVPTPEQPIRERSLAPARRQLSTRQQAAAWAEGHALETDQALALGLRLLAHGSGGATPLTRREQEVAGLVARGLTNRQIATKLVFTEATAAKHIEHILAKLGLTSRTQIAVWAGERRLLELRSS